MPVWADEVVTEANAWIEPDFSLIEHPLRVLDRKKRKTRRQTVRMYKIQWSHHTEEEATWETEEWQFQFWVEKGGKLGQLTVPPVHRHRLAFKVGKPFMQNLLRKTPYGLCESGRGYLDLQLSYSSFGTLLFKIFEFCIFKQRHSKTNRANRHRTTLCVAPTRGVLARCPRPPPTEAAPSLGIRAPNAPRFYHAHMSPSLSCHTCAPRTGRTTGPSRARRTSADWCAAIPQRHLCHHHHVTGERLFKVAPSPSRASCRAATIVAPPAMEAAAAEY
jgi:hypothetical protein